MQTQYMSAPKIPQLLLNLPIVLPRASQVHCYISCAAYSRFITDCPDNGILLQVAMVLSLEDNLW